MNGPDGKPFKTREGGVLKLHDLIEMTRAKGATLVLITHDPAIAERCDRVIHVADGRITDDAPAMAAAS